MRNDYENICFLPVYWLTDMEVYKMAAISIMYTPQEIINIVIIKQRYKFSQFGLRASMAASRSAGLGQFPPVTSLISSD